MPLADPALRFDQRCSRGLTVVMSRASPLRLATEVAPTAVRLPMIEFVSVRFGFYEWFPLEDRCWTGVGLREGLQAGARPSTKAPRQQKSASRNGKRFLGTRGNRVA